MEKEQYYYDYVYVVHGFLSEQECQEYIALGEQSGFVDAPITTARGPEMRKVKWTPIFGPRLKIENLCFDR